MPSITIGTLIYRSMTYAKSVYESLMEFTPHLHDGRAELLYVANDPEPYFYERFKYWLGYRQHSLGESVRHVVQNNPVRDEQWLFERGYGAPEYIHRVYRAWNRAILETHGDIVVLVNSDHVFSPNWLDNLLFWLKTNRMVCSQAVELPGFNGAYAVEFGRTPSTFNKQGFLEFVEKRRRHELRPSGVYMPVAFYRQDAIDAGLYPEGNLHDGKFKKIKEFGDAAFFRKMKERLGIEHVTAMDSIVYHYRNGEMDE